MGRRTPVVVGVAQVADRDSAPGQGLSPADLIAKAARLALADAGAPNIAAEIDTLATIRLFTDSGGAFPSPFGAYASLPHSIAKRLGATPRHLIYPPVGGNTPQMMVNILAERIAEGDVEVALLCGGEALRTQAGAAKAGLKLDWAEDAPAAPDPLMPETRMISRHEAAHGIALPVNVYPLFENALAAHYGRTPDQHRQKIGELMSRFTQVAAENPYAMLPIERTPEELITSTDDNRMIAWPYTKYLVSNLYTDQAAAILMMSTEAADRLGVPPSKRVHLHGSADTHDHYLVSDRVNYYSSPAIKAGAAHALDQAGVTPADLAHIDLYACFPSAVEVAADAIGLAHDDPRGLTLTGGLPYFGGPGNAYSLHGIAEAVQRCRAAPMSWGFIFANGGYLTKHSLGIYSTAPGYGKRAPPDGYQRSVDAEPAPALRENPEGAALVETFTTIYDRGSPARTVVIGRLQSGQRFLANAEPTSLSIGQPIKVTGGETHNLVVPLS